MITASAKVEKVDLAKRELTLKSENGKPYTINVPESVTGLENVKSGDRVRTTFYESVAVSVQKPGEAPVGTRRRTFNEQTPGELPGSMAGERITSTAKITKVNAAEDELTIQSPTGQETTIDFSDPEMRAELKKLKVGDKVQTTYTQAMATSVTPQHHM
jgi:hypothetical protein